MTKFNPQYPTSRVQKPTILILHGWQSSKEKWQAVKNLLKAQGLEAIIPDLPGFKPENAIDSAWSLNDYVEWLAKFAQENIKEPFFLIGHSFGGRIAIKFSLKYPEKLKGLILVSSAGIKPSQRLLRIWGMLSFLRKLSFMPGYQFLRKFFYFKILKKTDYYLVEGVMKEVFKKTIAEDLSPIISQIKTPTLLIWGEKDRTTPLRDGLFMKEKIKGAKIEILKGVNHRPYLETPEKLSQKITDFIKGL